MTRHVIGDVTRDVTLSLEQVMVHITLKKVILYILQLYPSRYAIHNTDLQNDLIYFKYKVNSSEFYSIQASTPVRKKLHL